MDNPAQKAAWLKKVRQKHRLFNQLVKYFMLEAKKAAKKREIEGKYLVRSCFTQHIPPQQSTGVNPSFPLHVTEPLPETICLSG
jgi:hypothetical protein